MADIVEKTLERKIMVALPVIAFVFIIAIAAYLLIQP